MKAGFVLNGAGGVGRGIHAVLFRKCQCSRFLFNVRRRIHSRYSVKKDYCSSSVEMMVALTKC